MNSERSGIRVASGSSVMTHVDNVKNAYENTNRTVETARLYAKRAAGMRFANSTTDCPIASESPASSTIASATSTESLSARPATYAWGSSSTMPRRVAHKSGAIAWTLCSIGSVRGSCARVRAFQLLDDLLQRRKGHADEPALRTIQIQDHRKS